MPLKTKALNELLKDLLAYREEQGWVDKDITKLKGRASEEELTWLKARQETAKKRIADLEDGVTKTVVRGFPSSFASIKTTAKSEDKKAAPKAIEKVVPLKDEPEIIEVPRSVLERINTVLEEQTAQVGDYTQIAKEQLDVSTTLKDIAEEDKAIHTNIAEITYPANGGTATIPIGTTIIDLWTGDVYLGDGTEEKLSDSLVSLGQLYVRSLHLDGNKAFTVKIDDKAEHSVAADDFFTRRGIECQRISITVVEATAISFWASTNPDASIDETRNVVVTGVETPLSSRQERYSYRTNIAGLAENSYGELEWSIMPAGERLFIGEIAISCNASLIQWLRWSLEVPGSEFWRTLTYDLSGEKRFGTYAQCIVDPGEQLKIRIYNRAGEALDFYLAIQGLIESI
jgi:hypothetical protein